MRISDWSSVVCSSDLTSASTGDTKVVAVTEADVKAGDAVHDTSGASVGSVEAVSASGAVIATGKSRIQVPLTSLGKNDKGLVISMSKAEPNGRTSCRGRGW